MIKKGSKVRYIGSKDIAKDKVFNVLHKSGHFVELIFPCRYLDGSIHGSKTLIPLKDVEQID